MKELVENKTIIMFVAVIILIGVIMFATNGFNFNLEDTNSKRISIYLYQEFEIQDVKNIVQEVLDKEIEVRYVGQFKEAVSVQVEDISDEQINTLKEKLSEKYTWDEETQKITTNSNIKVNLIDEIQKYIPSVLISFVIIAIYLAIRFKNIKNIFNLIIKIIVAELLAFSIIAITRIPLNEDTFSISILAYILAIIGETVNIIKKNKIEEEEIQN